MSNIDVRDYATARRVRLWEIAKGLHINDGNFSRRLRDELPEHEKAAIYKIIDELAANREVRE